jgi:hypothetical protein
MNVALLEKIAEKIQLVDARLFDMERFGYEKCPPVEGIYECGSAHCIGGWACALSGADDFNHEAAMQALDITQEQANLLFYPKAVKSLNGRLDHDDEGSVIYLFGGWDATPEQGAARIRHFIATNGTE